MLRKAIACALAVLPAVSAHAIILGEPESDPGARVTIRASNMAEFPICGGTLVSEQWVMTAAHCVVMGSGLDESTYTVTPPGDLSIVANSAELTNVPLNNFYEVSHVVVHPSYTYVGIATESGDGGYDVQQLALNNDIALLYLDRPVTGITPADLATPEDMLDIEARLAADWNDQYETNLRVDNVQALGWGTTTPDATDASNELLTTTNTFLPIDACYQRIDVGRDFPGVIGSADNETKVCVLPTKNEPLEEGGTQYGNSVCKGDSGGPLLDIATGKQIGITSGGTIILPICGSITIPAFFTKVSTYYDWVQSYITASEPPSAVITPPDFISGNTGGGSGGGGNDDGCYDGISTSNCNYRGSDSGGSVGSSGIWFLVLAAVYRIRQRQTA